MLTGMKPLPKALIIALPIVIALVMYMKFGPKHEDAPVVTPVAAQVVPAEATVVTAPVAAPVVEAAPAQVAEDNESAGMKALMQKGKK